jgi:ubiquinone/menaquinone biosynthesis C-methylase UbiE
MSTPWDCRARLYDVCEASDLRRGPAKSALFRYMTGRVLFVAIGTGIDICHFPPGGNVVAIDISGEMLCRSRRRQQQYSGSVVMVQADAQSLCFRDASFETVVTSCAMCSIPDPSRALRELQRVLRPSGQLLMFEHVRSGNPVLGLTLDLMTLFTRRVGTEMNRDTLRAVSAAGFSITNIESVYLDIILAVRATKAERIAAINQS